MNVLDNIGLGLFLCSIVSVIFWSPRPYLDSHHLNVGILEHSRHEENVYMKYRNIPLQSNGVRDFSSRHSPLTDDFGRMKETVDNQDLYSNSFTRTNEESGKPILNEIQNWIGTNQGPIAPQDSVNKVEDKTDKLKIESLKVENPTLDSSFETTSSLQDSQFHKDGELYKPAPTYDLASEFAKEKTSQMIHKAEAAIESANVWVADHAHDVFDKSGVVVDAAENQVGKIIDTTIHKMEMKTTPNFPNDDTFNIVETLEEDVCHENVNESNLIHNSLQVLDGKNIESNDKNATNILQNNVQLLGVDNSHNFIEENSHNIPQKLGEPWNQNSKDTGLNLIERSFTTVNNLWSAFVDNTKENEAMNEPSSHKESIDPLDEIENIDDDSFHDQQNDIYYKDTQKYNRQVNTQHYRPHKGYHKDITVSEEVKDRGEKSSNSEFDQIDRAYKRHKLSNYYDDIVNLNDMKYKAVPYYPKFTKEYDALQVGTSPKKTYNHGSNEFYKREEVETKVGYIVGKHTKGIRTPRTRHYRDGRHKASKYYYPTKTIAKNFGQNLQSHEYDSVYDENNEDDENHSYNHYYVS